MVMPFDSYPEGGRAPLGAFGGDNSRRGYGLRFMQRTGQSRCAYCGIDLISTYENWLHLQIDHVVPENVCRTLAIPREWAQDCINKVLACCACNAFRNRYDLPPDTICPDSLEEFLELGDRVFTERRAKILERHELERAFHAERRWEIRS